MDKYKIDSHKLMYHVSRVNNWEKGENVYPIYMELSPAGACNHRCTYCGLDFMEYKPRYLDTKVLKERLSELGKLGLKSVMYAGEGEPLLHRDMAELVKCTKMSGIDAAITTNGVLMDKAFTDEVLGDLEWIKISINGATPETYTKIHRSSPGDFDKVMENISYAQEIKRAKGYKCAIGMQLLLLPENSHEAVMLAEKARDIGLDYLVVKPYSQHPQSKTAVYEDVKYSEYEHLADELEEITTDDFSAIFRINTMKKWDDKDRNYHRCLALPFWSYIDAGGNVWGCSVYLGDKRFIYGNIYEKTFKEIWESKERQESLKWVQKKLDVSCCRVNCRMDEVNRYLWELRNPPVHVNFI